MNRSFFLPSLALVVGLVGCSAVPDKPTRANLYDFGPVTTPPETKAPSLPPLVLADVEAAGALDGTAMLYRLGYAEANELRPYAQARWSASPAQLVRLARCESRRHDGELHDLLLEDRHAERARQHALDRIAGIGDRIEPLSPA